MKTMKLVVAVVTVLLAAACSSQKVVSHNDTYLSAKEREKLNKSQQQAKASSRLDSRVDNFSRSSREHDDDYCYSCLVRRYSMGVWYDPWWWGPGWGPAWGWRSWYGPGCGWSWWSASWGPEWGWDPAYVGPGWYYTPGWGWTYYAGPGWWVAPSGTNSSSTSRYNYYRSRTYTAPSGSTTYTPPRSTAVTPGGAPPRRSASQAPTSPLHPSYTPASHRSAGSSRPSIQSGHTGTGGIRSFPPAGSSRPR